MHNLHQNETMEQLQENEGDEIMSVGAYIENSDFYFSKFEDKPTMDMVEEGKIKAKKRYEKLKVHEKWFIHLALVDLPQQIKDLETNQNQMAEWIEEWKRKYNKLKEERDTISENSKKEIKKLKKLLKEKNESMSVMTVNEPNDTTKSPQKRKNSNSEDTEKDTKKRRKDLFDTAPMKPPGSAQALYIRIHKVRLVL